MPLFEAARWAPSCNNGQPWRFIYARRGSPEFQDFVGFMSDRNQSWAKRAAILIVVVSKTTFDYKEYPYRTHSFDAGAAWENLALEGRRRGLVVHAMGGFNYDKAKEKLCVPDNFEVHCMIAIGKPGNPDELLDDKMKSEETPNGRRQLSDIIMEGRFRG